MPKGNLSLNIDNNRKHQIRIIEDKQKIFVSAFTEAFLLQVKMLESILLHRTKLPKSDDIKFISTITEIGSTIGDVAKSFPGAEVAATTLSAPLRIAEFITKIVDKRERLEEINKISKFFSNKLVLGSGNEYIIYETALNIVRIFEYQIFHLKENTDIRNMAFLCAERIVLCDHHNEAVNLELNATNLLVRLFQGFEWESDFKLQNDFGDEKWSFKKLITHTGIRLHDGSNLLKPKEHRSSSSVEKYGYRGQIIKLDEKDELVLTKLDHDKYGRETNVTNKHANYQPVFKLLGLNDLNTYKYQCEKGEYDRAKSYNENMGCLAVFCFGNFKDEILRFEGFNFSNSNFSNIDFREVSFKGTELDKTIFIGTKFRRVSFIGAKLIDTIIDGAIMVSPEFKDCKSKFISARKTKFNDIDETEFYDLNIKLSDGYDKEFRKPTVKEPDMRQQNNNGCITNITEKPLYIDRSHTDITLKRRLNDTSTLIITGISGSGKTSAALNYSHDYRKENFGSLVWVVNCTDRTSIEKDIIGLARALGWKLKEQKGEEFSIIIDFIVNQLKIMKTPYLIIYDNLQDKNLLNGLITPTIDSPKKDRIIVTTQLSSFTENEQDILRINGMSQDESKKLFDKIIEIRSANNGDSEAYPLSSNSENFIKFAERMSYLPVGIINAATYIYDNKIKDFNEFLREIDDHPEEVLNNDDINKIYITGENGTPNVRTSLLLSYLSKSKLAQDILKLSAFIDSKEIPVEYFSNFLQSHKISETDSKKALNELNNSYLIKLSTRDGKDYITLHQIVQDVVKLDLLKKTELAKEVFGYTAITLQEKFKREFGSNAGYIAETLPYLSHVKTFLKSIKNYNVILNKSQDIQMANLILSYNIGYFYSQISLANQSRELLLGVKNKIEKLLLIEEIKDLKDIESLDIEKNKKILELYSNVLYTLGRVYFYIKDQKMFDESEKCFITSEMVNEVINKGKEIKSFQLILSKRSGFLYILLESKQETDLLKAKHYYEEMVIDSNKYDDKGKEIVPKDDQNHVKICYRQLIRICKKLIEINEINENKVKEYYEEGEKYRKALIEKLGENPTLSNKLNASCYNEIAAFMLATLNSVKDKNSQKVIICKKMFTDVYNAWNYKNDKKVSMDITYADACDGLTKIAMLEKHYKTAISLIEESITVRNELCSQTHPDLINAIKLKESIEPEAKKEQSSQVKR